MTHTIQLGSVQPQLESRGVRLAILGPEGPERGRLVAKFLRARCPVLADPTRETSRAYGLTRRTTLRIQQSGTAVVDRDGLLVAMRRAVNPAFALNLGELLATLERLPRV